MSSTERFEFLNGSNVLRLHSQYRKRREPIRERAALLVLVIGLAIGALSSLLVLVAGWIVFLTALGAFARVLARVLTGG